jgi:hypothetical protein
MPTTTLNNTYQIASEFTAMLNDNLFIEAIDKFYASDVTVKEPVAMPPKTSDTTVGFDAVHQANVEWMEQHEIHDTTLGQPLVGENQFALYMSFDVTIKAANHRMTMEEMAVYILNTDGKIKHVEFFYHCPTM